MTITRLLALIAGSVGIRIGGAVLGLTTQLILARNFPQAEVGAVFLTMSMAAIGCLIVTAGYPTLALTQLPRFKYLKSHALVHAFHGAFLKDGIRLLILFCAVVGILAYALPLDRNLFLAIIFGALSAPGSSMLRYFGSLSNSLKRFALSQVPDSIIRPGLFLVYILARFATGGHPSLIEVLLAFVVANTLAAIINHFALGDDRLRLSDWKSSRPGLTKILRARALPLIIVSGVMTMFADIVTALGGFLLPADDVAVLGLTLRLAALAGFAIQTAQQFALPDLAGAVTARDPVLAHRLLLRLNIVTITVIMLGLLFVSIASGWLLSLFGPNYAQGRWLLVLFMAAQSIRALSGMNQHLLSLGGFQMRTAWACILSVFILVACWLIFVRQFGLLGVGFAVIAAELAWGIMLASQAQTLLSRRGDILWLMANRPIRSTRAVK